MVEGASVQGPKISGRLCINRRRSWRVIKQRQLTERFTWNVLLEERWLRTLALKWLALLATYEDLGARQGAFLDDVKVVAVVALSDDVLASIKADLLHRAQYDDQLLGVKCREHESLL